MFKSAILTDWMSSLWPVAIGSKGASHAPAMPHRPEAPRCACHLQDRSGRSGPARLKAGEALKSCYFHSGSTGVGFTSTIPGLKQGARETDSAKPQGARAPVRTISRRITCGTAQRTYSHRICVVFLFLVLAFRNPRFLRLPQTQVFARQQS